MTVIKTDTRRCHRFLKGSVGCTRECLLAVFEVCISRNRPIEAVYNVSIDGSVKLEVKSANRFNMKPNRYRKFYVKFACAKTDSESCELCVLCCAIHCTEIIPNIKALLVTPKQPPAISQRNAYCQHF
jgi:hypothetical protein